MRYFIVIALLVAAVLRADHAPEWLVSRAAAETALMGIPIEGTEIGALKKRFGKPVVEVLPDFPGETTYKWVSGGARVEVTTMHPPGAAEDGQEVYAVKVTSAKPSARAATSRGLRLGGHLADVVKLYGWRYQTSYRRDMSEESSTVTITFENETRLDAGFSDEGAIISLELVASME